MTYEEVECCPDDWDVWLRFETWIWAVLLLVQLSMAFYVFFVAVTFVDCALVIWRPSREWGETLFGGKYDSVITWVKDPETNKSSINPTIITRMNQLITHVAVPALGHAQPLFLTVIAVNRFTAFAFPLKHASMWRSRTVVAATISLAVMSALLGSAWPIAVTIHQAVKCSRLTIKQREEQFCAFTWAFDQIFIPNALITVTSAICCVVSFLLNVGSIAMLVVLRTTGRLQRKGPELQLFAHSLWMFLLQLFLAFQDVVYFMDNPDYILSEIGLNRLRSTQWAYFRHSTEWLAGVKATREWTEMSLLFMAGCTVYIDEKRPMCSVWYLLVTGQLYLREHTAFTVRTLELCLLALSGSVFLLLISGNVRSAYFNFYFKWQCLSKKWGQRAGVKVFTRMSRRAPTSSVPSTGMSMPSRP